MANSVQPDETKFNLACEQFRGVCAKIREFLGNENFRGGFDEYAVFMNSEAFAKDPTTGLTLAMMWSGANEYCVYEGQKLGYGQPEWWYKCWGLEPGGQTQN